MNKVELKALIANTFVMTEVEVESYTKSEIDELEAVEVFETN